MLAAITKSGGQLQDLDRIVKNVTACDQFGLLLQWVREVTGGLTANTRLSSASDRQISCASSGASKMT